MNVPLVTATSTEPLAEFNASRVVRPPPRRRKSMSATASRSPRSKPSKDERSPSGTRLAEAVNVACPMRPVGS